MENNSQLSAANATAGYPVQPPYEHLLQHQQQQQLEKFWDLQRKEIEEIDKFKNHQLPLARIKKIMKANKNVRMISAETPILFSKACELFIKELTLRSWLHTEEDIRRTLQKNNVATAIRQNDIYDFLSNVVHRDEIKKEVTAMVGPMASGVPYNYPPRPAILVIHPSSSVQPMPPPSQVRQSVWQAAAKDNSNASGGNSGQGSFGGQS